MSAAPRRVNLSVLGHGFERRGDDAAITGITEDSRRLSPGMLFVAVPGSALDGHDYIHDAVRRGASAVAAERLDAVPDGVPALRVDSARAALAVLAARFFEEPQRGLTLVGFTGTFGKTSTSDVLRRLLDAGGARTGVLGSLGARYGAFHDAGSGLTTPAPVELQRMLRDLRAAGADTVIMEVTSHALRMDRVAGLRFAGGLLAAIERGEHTDFHHSFEDYVDAKRIFFDYLADDALLAYDADNAVARQLAASRPERAVGFSLEGRPAGLTLDNVTLDGSGARFRVSGPLSGAGGSLRSALLGRGHLRNVSLALTYALAAGVPLDAAGDVLRTLTPLRRRMERYEAAGRMVLDDTAAHPDSLRATFDVAAMLRRNRLVVVYAVRGMRGVAINQRNADALADLAAGYRVSNLIVTASTDAAGPQDRVTGEEAGAVRDSLERGGAKFTWHDTLRNAMDAALESTSSGDILVLAGAQGMNEGKKMLDASAPASAPTETSRS